MSQGPSGSNFQQQNQLQYQQQIQNQLRQNNLFQAQINHFKKICEEAMLQPGANFNKTKVKLGNSDLNNFFGKGFGLFGDNSEDEENDDLFSASLSQNTDQDVIDQDSDEINQINITTDTNRESDGSGEGGSDSGSNFLCDLSDGNEHLICDHDEDDGDAFDLDIDDDDYDEYDPAEFDIIGEEIEEQNMFNQEIDYDYSGVGGAGGGGGGGGGAYEGGFENYETADGEEFDNDLCDTIDVEALEADLNLNDQLEELAFAEMVNFEQACFGGMDPQDLYENFDFEDDEDGGSSGSGASGRGFFDDFGYFIEGGGDLGGCGDGAGCDDGDFDDHGEFDVYTYYD